MKKSELSKEEILYDRLMRGTYAYLNEKAVRQAARDSFADFYVIIVHSKHPANPRITFKGTSFSLDYWIDEPGIVRSWEKVLFEGYGRDA